MVHRCGARVVPFFGWRHGLVRDTAEVIDTDEYMKKGKKKNKSDMCTDTNIYQTYCIRNFLMIKESIGHTNTLSKIFYETTLISHRFRTALASLGTNHVVFCFRLFLSLTESRLDLLEVHLGGTIVQNNGQHKTT